MGHLIHIKKKSAATVFYPSVLIEKTGDFRRQLEKTEPGLFFLQILCPE